MCLTNPIFMVRLRWAGPRSAAFAADPRHEGEIKGAVRGGGTAARKKLDWSDGSAAWCRCRRCRELSDSDQSFLVENAIVKALRSEEPGAQVAHLACHVTMPPPQEIRPEAGVFLQFAPARRRYDLPYSQQRSQEEKDSLWYLERNLEVFPAATAQALEYWLDVSLFSHGRRLPLPWDRDRVRADIGTYRALGIQHIKSFANDLDAEYVRRNGEPTFLAEYGAALEDAFDR